VRLYGELSSLVALPLSRRALSFAVRIVSPSRHVGK
jgi:hypothetical protein